GAHPLLLYGPPGTGKSMAARMLPWFAPPLPLRAGRDAARLYKAARLLEDRQADALPACIPVRAPHPTRSPTGLAGGGLRPAPGEVSLAHGGVLLLDELHLFRKET